MSIDIPLNVEDISDEQLASLAVEIKKCLSSNTIQKSLFTHQLSEDEWHLVEEYAEKLNADYEQRAQLSLKRLDVTIDSFLWSDRTKKFEAQIKEFYGPIRASLAPPPPVGIDDLLSATTELLLIQKASSSHVRLATCNEFCLYTVKQTPTDRGGRTSEMVAPPPDASYWQQQKRQRQGDSGQAFHHGDSRHRGGGGGFFQQYREQRTDHVENVVKQQHNPHQRGRGGGGSRGNRGGGRPRY